MNTTFIAGPCVIESAELLDTVAARLTEINRRLGVQIIFKASFDKANRTSIRSYRGVGMEKGLQMLADVRSKWGLRLLTDIHESWQAAPVGEVVDVIQIPAFLCRQTDLLVAAAKTGRTVNIKKAQFLSGEDMRYPYEKACDAGAADVWLTERGNSFGYNSGHGLHALGAASGRRRRQNGRQPRIRAGNGARGQGIRCQRLLLRSTPRSRPRAERRTQHVKPQRPRRGRQIPTLMEQSKQNEILTVAREAIRTEADALEKMERSLDEHFVEAIEMILQSRGKLIITGMGKSGLIGRKMAATFASTGTPSFYLHPGEAFHGDLGMISKEDIVLAISYSGETDEVLKIVPFIHNNGNRLISMTGNPASTLAIHSDIHLDVSVDHEACILHLAPTTSTTAQIAMGDAMAVALMKMRNFSSNDFARLHPGGSLGRRLLATVGDVMRSDNLPVVGPDCTAKDMIHTISRCGLGLIVVCEGDRIEGIVTDGDIRRAMERSGADFINLRAADILTRNPKRIHPEEKLIEAEKMMTRHKITSLLVTDRDERLAGVIQIYDIKL